jgi:hypothetical protein
VGGVALVSQVLAIGRIRPFLSQGVVWMLLAEYLDSILQLRDSIIYPISRTVFQLDKEDIFPPSIMQHSIAGTRHLTIVTIDDYVVVDWNELIGQT